MPNYASSTSSVGSSASRPWRVSGTPHNYTSWVNPAIVGHDNDRQNCELALRVLDAEVANFGNAANWDDSTQADFEQLLRRFRSEMAQQVFAGQVTWREAAEQTYALRDLIVQVAHAGHRALVESTTAGTTSTGSAQPPTDRSMNTRVGQTTLDLYGQSAQFNQLTDAQKNQVYAAVVEVARRHVIPRVSTAVLATSQAGKGLVVAAQALTVYDVALAQDNAAVAAAMGTTQAPGAGPIAGGTAPGETTTLAGLACDPGAPVCVTASAFVDGALSALGLDVV